MKIIIKIMSAMLVMSAALGCTKSEISKVGGKCINSDTSFSVVRADTASIIEVPPITQGKAVYNIILKNGMSQPTKVTVIELVSINHGPLIQNMAQYGILSLEVKGTMIASKQIGYTTAFAGLNLLVPANGSLNLKWHLDLDDAPIGIKYLTVANIQAVNAITGETILPTSMPFRSAYIQVK
jgi:hypothetical protein